MKSSSPRRKPSSPRRRGFRCADLAVSPSPLASMDSRLRGNDRIAPARCWWRTTSATRSGGWRRSNHLPFPLGGGTPAVKLGPIDIQRRGAVTPTGTIPLRNRRPRAESRHPRAGGDPDALTLRFHHCRQRVWIPACAGMTKIAIWGAACFPGGGRGPFGKAVVTQGCASSPACPHWTPASAGEVEGRMSIHPRSAIDPPGARK
jgi:hypothetical protein